LALKTVLEETINQLQVDAAAVFLFNPYTLMLEIAKSIGFHNPAVNHIRLGLGEGVAGQAALEHRTIVIPNLAESAPIAGLPQLAADEGFHTLYAVPLIAKGQLIGVLDVFHRAPLNPNQNWLHFLETLAGQAAMAIDMGQSFENLQRSHLELTLAYETTIEGWSRALDLRDKETEGHTLRVTDMTVKLARLAGLTEAELAPVRRGALLHDIGKLGVPDAILLKPGKLTDAEWELMRQHPTHAYELLSPIPYLSPALESPYCHHEKWDGSGYPRGLSGEQIPLSARLFAVVDVWDALRSDRPYRPSWPEDKVRAHICALSGTHFDPWAVQLYLQILNEGAQIHPDLIAI
ncbi:MAG: HD-GYP domain-containing protein, partial [Anaerolineales bacterium]